MKALNQMIEQELEDGRSTTGSPVTHCQDWVGISTSLLGFPLCSQDGSVDPDITSLLTSPKGRAREELGP